MCPLDSKQQISPPCWPYDGFESEDCRLPPDLQVFLIGLEKFGKTLQKNHQGKKTLLIQLTVAAWPK